MALRIAIRALLHLTLFLLAQRTHSDHVPVTKSHAEAELKPQPSVYIVLADPLAKPPQFATQEHWYTSIMTGTNSPSRLVHVYDTVIHGFAAELTDEQARLLAKNTTGVAGVYRDRAAPLHTTRSPGFLGLDEGFGVWPETEFGDGVIIGFVDTGIWPESESFNDAGLGPVRSSWKGRCVDDERFNASLACNNKLVGARNLVSSADLTDQEFRSPRDSMGHGTHVSSTAAGSAVPDAELFQFAKGTARGVAPRARVAMYKACRPRFGCSLVDIVAAIDAAVKDGVDVLSLSLGGEIDPDFYDDPVSVALFGAVVRAGVFVACSAGNAGPTESSLINGAPWITTVGAATVDRTFPVSVTLGDGQVLAGQSLYAEKSVKTEMLPLVPSNCYKEDLVPGAVMGKVVVCTRGAGVSTGIMVQNAGGSGLLSLEPIFRGVDELMAQPFTLPAVSLDSGESRKLTKYLRSTLYPKASFCFTCRTVTGETRAPVVVSFSSRGPNHVAPEILKPDVVAPGVNVLAAWPDEVSLIETADDARRTKFNIISGTSMACPHVAGVAALIRHRHRDWSPAMIRSAIMTTATALDNRGRAVADGGRAATPFAAGSGLVQPQLVLDPGLVYDAGEQDYVDFLCAMNYTTAQVRVLVPGFTGCTRTLPGGVAGLNYPSFVVAFGNDTGAVCVLERTVTKVSEGPETYAVKVEVPDQLVAVTVTPATLEFGKEKNEKKSYKVVFRSTVAAKNVTRFGNIVWENQVHRVKSPVVFVWE